MDQMNFIFFVVIAASAFWICHAARRGILALRKMHAMMLVAFLALSGVVAVIGDKTNGLMRVIGPLWSPPPVVVTVTETDIARGWRVESVITNSTYSYEMPTNAIYVGNWHIHGARTSLGNHKVDFGAMGSVSPDEWAFPLGTNFESFTSFWYFVDGRIRPTPRDAAREIRAAGGPMFAMPGSSRLWAAEDSDGGQSLTWENFFLGNDTNTPINAQIRLYENGDFTTSSNELVTVCRRVEPFDWDGDGLSNSIDPDPYTGSADCHGTCAAWYNIACSNILTAVDRDYGIELAWHDGVNQNAYYFVEVVAESGPAQIVFSASQAGNLGSPVFVAQAGETNTVPLLVGVEYSVTSTVPISVSTPAVGYAQVTFDSSRACRIHWPISFVFTEAINGPTQSGGTSRTYSVTASPYDPGGVFSWGQACLCGCMTCSGSAITFACTPGCACGASCGATGSFGYEGLVFPVSGGECRCGFTDTSHPTQPQTEGPCLSVSFSDSAVIFEDTYKDSPGIWKPKRSTRTWLTVYANGGPNGGLLSLTSQNLQRLSPVACGPVVLPATLNLAANQTYSAQYLFEGDTPSVAANDISVSGSILPTGSIEPIQSSATITSVKVELTPQFVVGNLLHRHSFGVCESVVCQWSPAMEHVTVTDLAGGVVTNVTSGYCYYLCGTNAAAKAFWVDATGTEYIPLANVAGPSGVFVGEAREEESAVASGFAGGVEMSMLLYVAPTNVSFRGLSFMEVPSSDSIVTGYFLSSDFASAWQHGEEAGAGVWHAIGSDNFFFDDHPSMNYVLDAPWSEGVLSWTIPFGWNRVGDASATNEIGQTTIQRFDFNASGRLRLTKFGYWVERDADGSTRRSEGVLEPR